MADLNETIKISRPQSGFHIVTVTVKEGIVTSTYSYKTTQSNVRNAVSLCRHNAIQNLIAATAPEEGESDGVVPQLRAVPTVGSPDS